jgi:ribosomal protein S18 acetylase RimI-like enzyme
MPEDAVPFPALRTRLATAADIPRLVELINAAYSIEEFLEGTRTDLEALTAALEKGSILVLEEDGGSLLGSIYAELRGTRGYLGMLAVDPERQGQGLARRLMESAEAHFRALGCRAIDILVLSLRPELLPLYRRLGFVETGTEEFSYPRSFRAGVKCHCIAMSKPL